MRTALRVAGAGFLSLAVWAGAGCAGVEVASNVKQVRSIIKEARENGAYRCALRAGTQSRAACCRPGNRRPAVSRLKHEEVSRRGT